MSQFNRREFLSLCLKGGVSLAALSQLQLGAMSAFAAESASDFKALVCIFLYGGNDSFNMLVPLEGESLTAYQATRQTLAVSGALALNPLTPVADGIGLNPAMASCKPLFDDGKLAFVSSLGSLMAPLSLTEYKQKSAAIPAHLFSHNDQQATWMRGREHDSLSHGWGGRMLELLSANNHFAANVSLDGVNQWQRGQASNPFTLSKSGVTSIRAFQSSGNRTPSFRALINELAQSGSGNFGGAYSQGLGSAIGNTEAMNAAMAQAPTFDGVFSDNSLSAQLKAVAQSLTRAPAFGLGRQVYFVSMGGFDTHDDQAINHPLLLQTLATALTEFDTALGQVGLRDSVTSFTMSDFGRTLTSNGDGTDHGWAGVQMLMGGAVRGGDIHGKVELQSRGVANDVGGGRLIPAFANEQYFAQLAGWFGLSAAQQLELFPNLANFNAGELSLFR